MIKEYIFQRKFKIFCLFILIIGSSLLMSAINFLRTNALLQKNAHEQTKLVARGVAFRHQQLVSETQQLLNHLSESLALSNYKLKAGNEFFWEKIKDKPQYTNVSFEDLTGEVIYSAVKVDGVLNIMYKRYTQDALAKKRFIVGNYQIGTLTDIPVLPFAMPVERGVFVAFVNLSWLGEMERKLPLPKDINIFVIDNEGTVLYQIPESRKYVGWKAKNVPLVATILDKKEGSAWGRGLDNETRYYYFAPLAVSGQAEEAFVAAGMSTAIINQQMQKDLIYHVIFLLIIISLAILILKSDSFISKLRYIFKHQA